MKLGIIGAGRLGSFHADKAAQHPAVELTAVYDASETAAQKLAQKHNVRQCATLDEVFPLADAVVIAVPTVLHYELGWPCLRQGKHVLMEKPMCASTADAQKLVEAAKRANAVLQIGHVEAFNPAWVAAQPLLQEATDGFPVQIDAVRTSGYTFRSTDIGTVFDMMIHDIDLVLSLVPSRVDAVDAVGFNVIGGAFEDKANVRIRFENGTVANLTSSRTEPKAVREMRITQPSSAVHIDFGARTTSLFRPDDTVRRGMFAPENVSPQEVQRIAPDFMQKHFIGETKQYDAVDALAAEMDDFVNAVETGYPPVVSGLRGLAAVALAEKIVESLNERTMLQFGLHRQRRAA
ncbi:MAG: Gfo/Idh/MocA family oxidoreductase [Planctomycetaceae bacterium]|jgi:predicted dehydrogenase|nr:Gfo/Idh/MocA family oxidoreductase [Planctomycetaceae bacterium]